MTKQITYDAMNQLVSQMAAHNINEDFNDMEEVSTAGYIAATQSNHVVPAYYTQNQSIYNIPTHNTVNTVINPPYPVVIPNSPYTHSQPVQNTTVNSVVNPPYQSVFNFRKYCVNVSDKGKRCNRLGVNGCSLCQLHLDAAQKRAQKDQKREMEQRKDVVGDSIKYGNHMIKDKVACKVAELQQQIDVWKKEGAKAEAVLASFEPMLLQLAYNPSTPLANITVDVIHSHIMTSPTTTQHPDPAKRLDPWWLQRS
jgi:hypothetical protein